MGERSLAGEWDAQAGAWARWTRTPGHDRYYPYNLRAFLELIPPPTGTALDLGCGEGRVGVALRERRHRIVGVDLSRSAHLGRPANEQRSYLDVQRTRDEVDRDGIAFAFHQMHRPLEAWLELFFEAGLRIEALREPRPSEADIAAEAELANSRAKPAVLHVRCRR